MFKKEVVVLSALIIALIAITAWYVLALNPDDIKTYQKMVQSIEPSSLDQNDPYSSKQKREKVSKYAVYNDALDRLHVNIVSARSEMVLDHHDETTEVVEHLQNVHCFMQEELYYILEDGREVTRKADGSFQLRKNKASRDSPVPITDSTSLKPMQLLRYFEADNASYYYRNDRLVAHQVKIFRYEVPGHQEITSIQGLKPIISGEAESAEFSLAGQNVHFKAHQVKAKFFSSGAKKP